MTRHPSKVNAAGQLAETVTPEKIAASDAASSQSWLHWLTFGLVPRPEPEHGPAARDRELEAG